MDTVLWVFCVCLFLGAFVGFMAGLLGIGGGLIVVPALLYLLPFTGMSAAQLPVVAVATSLAAIMITTLASTRAHARRGNIPWGLCKLMAPGLAIGALLASVISNYLSAQMLQQSFAIFVMLMALQMVLPLNLHTERTLPHQAVLFACAVLVAFIAGLMGIGGAVLLVPLLTFYGVQMRHAVGCAAISGLLISIVGSFGYIIAGSDIPNLPVGTWGFIYLPAWLGVVSTSMWMAPVGAHAASRWPTPILKKLFALLLLCVGLKLIWG